MIRKIKDWLYSLFNSPKLDVTAHLVTVDDNGEVVGTVSVETWSEPPVKNSDGSFTVKGGMTFVNQPLCDAIQRLHDEEPEKFERYLQDLRRLLSSEE